MAYQRQTRLSGVDFGLGLLEAKARHQITCWVNA
jgi:hypothetical protein